MYGYGYSLYNQTMKLFNSIGNLIFMTTAKLMKTGQTTSYRTGDDGDIEAGREVSFTVLGENNPFGNTYRFTDELGGQTYTNNWVIDWSTYNGSEVLGYYRLIGGNVDWATAIDGSLGTLGTFTGGRLANIKELQNLARYQNVNSGSLDYSPINITAASIWTSNTDFDNSTNAIYFVSYYGTLGVIDKTASGAKKLVVRDFTVTGTTLS